MGKTGEPKVWGLLEGLFGSGVWVGVAYEGEEVEEDEDEDWEMHCRQSRVVQNVCLLLKMDGSWLRITKQLNKDCSSMN